MEKLFLTFDCPEMKDAIRTACIKRHLMWNIQKSTPNTIEVEIEGPMDAYYLGANVVSESMKIFITPLTV